VFHVDLRLIMNAKYILRGIMNASMNRNMCSVHPDFMQVATKFRKNYNQRAQQESKHHNAASVEEHQLEPLGHG
jgi:hypothetical protein